jgi:hypothetical protein
MWYNTHGIVMMQLQENEKSRHGHATALTLAS